MKIKVTVDTGWANGEHVDYWELPPNWDKLSEDEKQTVLCEYGHEYMMECCSSYGELVEDED